MNCKHGRLPDQCTECAIEADRDQLLQANALLRKELGAYKERSDRMNELVCYAYQRGDEAMRRLRASEKLLIESRSSLAALRFYAGATNDSLIDQIDFCIDDLKERSPLRFDSLLTTSASASVGKHDCPSCGCDAPKAIPE